MPEIDHSKYSSNGISEHFSNFNGYIDSRIDTLKSKIDVLTKELDELEKLSQTPE